MISCCHLRLVYTGVAGGERWLPGRRTVGALWLVVALLGWAAGIGWPAAGWAAATKEADARHVTDDAGRRVVVPAGVARIVSLSPALTETVCVLGACGRLVGVDRFSGWPESVQRLPKLGGLGSISVEGLLALRPGLVLMGRDEALLQKLERLGVPVLVLAPTRLADVAGVMQRLEQVLGLAPGRARAEWQAIETRLQKLAESLPVQVRGWRVLAEVDPVPWLAGPASFMGEMLARLGLGNVVTEASRPFVPVSREWVLQADPDLLLLADPQQAGLAALRARPGWGRLRALREGRVCLFHGEALDTLVRPGPRLADGAGQVVDCVRSMLAWPSPAP